MPHSVKCVRQAFYGSLDISQLIQPEQPDPESAEIVPLTTHERHARGYLQALLDELLARMYFGIRRVTNHHTGSREPSSGAVEHPLCLTRWVDR